MMSYYEPEFRKILQAENYGIAIIDHLNLIALDEYQLSEILEAAADILPDLVAISLESIGNLVQNVGKDLNIYAEAYYNQLPEYAQVIIQTVEYAKRNGILGNNFYLTSIEYTRTNRD